MGDEYLLRNVEAYENAAIPSWKVLGLYCSQSSSRTNSGFVLLPAIERRGVGTPLLQPFPFIRIVRVFAALRLHNPHLAVTATHEDVWGVGRNVTDRLHVIQLESDCM